MPNLWRNFSLRTRLTALSAGLLASILLALGGALYANLRRFLLDSTAVRVRAQAKPVIERELKGTQGAALAAFATGLSHALTSRDTNAAIFDGRGELLAQGKRLPEEPAMAVPRRAELLRALAGAKDVTYVASFDRPGDIAFAGGGRKKGQRAKQAPPRLASAPFSPPAGPRALVALVPLRRSPASPDVLGVAQLTTPLTQIDLLLARQRRMIGLGLALALGLGILGDLWLVRSSLAPLGRVIATIRRIAGGDLSQRVQLSRAGDEVGQLGAAFDQMASHLEEAFSSQARFVSAASHELRTPLTALQGSLEVLQRGSQDDPAATHLLLGSMHREVTRLSRLTEQLLALTRLDAPEALNIRSVDVARWLDDVVGQAEHLAGSRQLQVVRGPRVALRADPDLLTQVWLNLIDNAVQHTGPDGKLQLGWTATEAALVFWVADDGEGIAPEDLPHIFEAFYRGDRSRSRRHGGAGLGLAIVQAIVRAHGGSIEVEGRPGEGARFTMRMPLSGPIVEI
jgi:signal transduction histidine kinase